MSSGEFRELLQRRGLKAGDVARQLGVHKNTVSNWATGKTPVVPPHLGDLARLLDTSIDELAGITPRSTPLARPSEQPGEPGALDVLGRLLESAGAVRSMYHAAPNLMDVLRDAEELVRRHGYDPAPQRPRRDPDEG
jgi:transcriptional regulator with XRE-family HTH domain